MKRSAIAAAALPLCILLAHCGGDGGDGGGSGGGKTTSGARIQTQLASAALAPAGSIPKFRAGAASAVGLESLKYQISTIMICEALQVSGSGFNNPTKCIELYKHDDPEFRYGLQDDWTALANKARTTDSGFIDLVSPASRMTLAGATPLTQEHVGSYHYGIINWSLPIKVKATVTLADGTSLYTHDGTTRSELVGADNFKAYFTEPRTSLALPPAEEAVVLHGNGGNWFKFQSPLTITAADIDERREFVLDLVFNPDGIVQGFEGAGMGNLSERGDGGTHLRDITVPMLDLAPVPHRASEQVLRETYQGPVAVDGNEFDLRVELYYVEGDPSGTLYGVDAKTLVNARTRSVPPSFSKVSFIDRAVDGTLTFASFNRSAIFSGFTRVTGASGTSRVKIVCAEHSNRAGATGGAAIVVDRCPSPTLDVTLALTARGPVSGSVPVAVGAGPADAGTDGGTDGGAQALLIGDLDAGLR